MQENQTFQIFNFCLLFISHNCMEYKNVQFYGVLFVDDMFTHRHCSDLGQCNCLDKKKPDFSNSFNNNNNQIEKLPKKQKKTIRNVSTNQSLNYLFYSF